MHLDIEGTTSGQPARTRLGATPAHRQPQQGVRVYLDSADYSFCPWVQV